MILCARQLDIAVSLCSMRCFASGAASVCLQCRFGRVALLVGCLLASGANRLFSGYMVLFGSGVCSDYVLAVVFDAVLPIEVGYGAGTGSQYLHHV